MLPTRYTHTRYIYFNGFSDFPKAPAPLCDHGLLDSRNYARTTTTCEMLDA